MLKTIRDPGVEIARLFGCLIVIGCHTYLPISENNSQFDFTRTFIVMVCADGVAVFWFILGCFIFRNQKSYSKLCKDMSVHILIPLAMISAITFYLFPYTQGATLINSIRRPLPDYVDALKATAVWKAIRGGEHLWYLYVYTLVIISFPAMKGVVVQIDSSKKQYLFFAGVFFLLSANAITGNRLMNFSHVTIGGLIPGALMTICGHIVYSHKNALLKYGWAMPIAFIILNIIRVFVYKAGLVYVLSWISPFGLLCSTFILVFSFSITEKIHNNTAISLICKMSSYTFSIYLFHNLVIGILKRNHFMDLLINNMPSSVVTIIHPLIMTTAVFLVTLVISIIFRKCHDIILKINQRFDILDKSEAYANNLTK